MKTAIYRWALKKLRLLLDAADEWLHARESQFRAARMEASAPAVTDEFNRATSAARERAIKKSRAPRLRYQHGQFVREA